MGGSKRLYRSRNERMVGGVAGGLAEYFDIDPTLVRLAFVFASLYVGFGLIPYIILWVVIPKEPEPGEVPAGLPAGRTVEGSGQRTLDTPSGRTVEGPIGRSVETPSERRVETPIERSAEAPSGSSEEPPASRG